MRRGRRRPGEMAAAGWRRPGEVEEEGREGGGWLGEGKARAREEVSPPQ
jgi:hypothetical protein